MGKPQISRKTVLAIAEVYDDCFEYSTYPGSGMTPQFHVRTDWLGDLLFEKGRPKPLIDHIRKCDMRGIARTMVIGLASGDWDGVLPDVTKEKDDTARAELRNEFIRLLAEDILEYASRKDILKKPLTRDVDALKKALAADGFTIRNGRVVAAEEDPVDPVKEADELRRLFQELQLEGADLFDKALATAEEHYDTEKPGDCIKHCRDAMEVALLGVARAASGKLGKSLARSALPGPVRAFLHQNGIVNEEEKELLFALHTVLSVQGGHANMSEREHARISRQYALTTTHFILLRWRSMAPTIGGTS